MDSRKMPLYGGAYIARPVLLASGLVAVLIAGTILVAPELLYADSGIELDGNATLANELKAPSGALLAAGLMMLAGVFRARYAVASLAAAALVYLSYGLSRLASFAIDGLPHSSLMGATALELSLGTVCLLTLLPARRAAAG